MNLEMMGQYRILFTDARVATSEGELTRGWLLTDGRIIKGFGEGDPPENILVEEDHKFM